MTFSFPSTKYTTPHSITYNSTIFKTITDGLNDIYVVGNKINEINALKLDATNITGYATALNGLSAKQAELILSTKGLSIAQQQAILSETTLLGATGKLTTAELEAMLITKKRNKDQAEALLIKTGLITSETAEATATNVVTAAKLKELVQTKALTQAEADLIAAKAGVTLASQKESVSLLAGIGAKIKGAGTALKGLGTGILTIASAHPVIAGITAAIALCGGAAIVNKVKQEKAAKAIKEAYESAKTAIDDINSSFENTKSNTKQISQEYAELAQGVNLLTNENKKLSTEKYERFLDLSNQLSSLYPSLTKRYDENGNAILDLSGSVDTIVGSLDDLIERQRTLANQEIVKQMPDLFKGYTNNVTDYEDELKNAENTKEAIQSAYDEISKYGIYTAFDLNGNATNENGDPVALKLGQYIDLLKKLGITAKQVNLKDSMGQVIGYKLELEDGSDIPNLSGIHDAYVSAFNQAQEDVKYAQQQLDAERSSINQYLNTWLQTEFSYNQIENDGMQKAIQEMLFNFDWNSLPEGIDKNDWNAVSEYLRRNILFAINNVQDNPEISKAISEVFSNTELTPDEKADYIKQIQNYFGEDNVITLLLKPQFEETETLQKQYDDAITKFGEESQDTLEKFFKDNSINDSSEIDYWNSVTEGAKTAEEAVRMYNDAKQNDNKTDNLFYYDKLSDIPQKLSEVENAYKTAQDALNSYNEKGYYSMDVIDSILSLENEYIDVLVDSNGQIQINSESMNKLAEIKIETAKASIYQETCEELVRIKTLDTSLAAQELALVNGTLAESAYETARALYEEVQAMGGANAALADNVWSSATKKISLLDNQLNSLKNKQYDVGISVKDSSASTKDTWKEASEAAKKYIESFMEYQRLSLEKGQIDYNTYCNTVSNLLKNMFKEGKISAEEYHNYTKKMLEEQKDIYDKALLAIERRIQKEIDKYDELIEKINERNEALEKQKSLMEDSASAVVQYLQSQLNKYSSLANVADKYYEDQQDALQKQKEALQESIDLLQEENDELDLQERKRKAIADLERAKNLRTKLVYSHDNGFTYQTDGDAIAENQKTLEDIQTEELIHNLEKEQGALDDSIDALQKYRDAINDIADAYSDFVDIQNVVALLGENYAQIISGMSIEDWEATKDKVVGFEKQKDIWSSLSDVIDKETKKQNADIKFGADWQKKIDECRLVDFNEFKDEYLEIQEQINDNTAMIESYEEKISYYEKLKKEWSDIADAYENSIEDQYASMILGRDWEKSIFDERRVALNNFKNDYLKIQQAITDAAWNAANEQNKANASIKASSGGSAQPTQTNQKTDTPKEGKWYVYDKNSGTKLSIGYTTKAAANQKKKLMNPAQYPSMILAVKEFHTGLDEGYVGDAQSKDERLKILQKAGNGELLKQDEVPAILKRSELVFTEPQQINLVKTLMERQFTPNINMPDYSHLDNVVRRSDVQPMTFTMGDIHLHEVNDVNSFSKEIVTQFPNKMLQAIHRR